MKAAPNDCIHNATISSAAAGRTGRHGPPRCGYDALFDSADVMTTDDPLKPDALATLRARFEAQSRRAQAYYNVMHEAKRGLGSDDAANAWMNAPLAAFEGVTPARMVDQGREEQVLAWLRAQKS
jgi:hypothetical protein